MTFDIAFIGTGPEPDNPVWGESAAMAYRHAAGYRRHEDCDLVACADLVRENAEAFADEFHIDRDGVYDDYGEMLETVAPDVVSVCTPVPTHAPIVTDCVTSGHVRAVHCEKPMADTWGDARRMAAAADEHDVQLTFNHQRRFDAAVRAADDLIGEGAIGEIERVECGPRNVLDHGTHVFDLATKLTDATPIEWVIGQVDYREENVRYGTHNVNQAVAQWQYEDGVSALAAAGDGARMIGCALRVRGSEGVLELGVNEDSAERNRVSRDGSATWERVGPSESGNALHAGIAHVVDSLDAGVEPETSAGNALVATELIFAIYESVRRRGRVDLPLDAEDNALEALVDAGEIVPAPADD